MRGAEQGLFIGRVSDLMQAVVPLDVELNDGLVHRAALRETHCPPVQPLEARRTAFAQNRPPLNPATVLSNSQGRQHERAVRAPFKLSF